MQQRMNMNQEQVHDQQQQVNREIRHAFHLVDERLLQDHEDRPREIPMENAAQRETPFVGSRRDAVIAGPNRQSLGERNIGYPSFLSSVKSPPNFDVNNYSNWKEEI